MYIAYDEEDENYLLHISIKNEIPPSIDKKKLLQFENNEHIDTVICIYELLRKDYMLLRKWRLIDEDYKIYGYVNGEVVLRVCKK